MVKSNKKKNTPTRDALVLGLGLVDLTRDKIEKIILEATKGISKQDKEKAVGRLFKHVSSARRKAESAVCRKFQEILKEMGLEIKKKK